LQVGDGGVAAHETACRILQVATCYDQLHVSQLACVEVVARLIQMTQMRYRERFLGVPAKSGPSVDQAHGRLWDTWQAMHLPGAH
jgi:hypothetical protein